MRETDMNWKVSAYSTSGANCLEADGAWKVSTYSSNDPLNCVEVGAESGAEVGCLMVRVRDTKEREQEGRSVVAFGGGAWTAFVRGVAG